MQATLKRFEKQNKKNKERLKEIERDREDMAIHSD